MIPVLSAAEMREADRRTIQDVGLPGAVLMENAGAAVAEAIRRRFPAIRRPMLLCGRGNNGGDGFVVARRLLDLDPAVVLVGARAEVKGDAALHLAAFEKSGGKLSELPDARAWGRAKARLADADLVVDALLGTGLQQAPRGLVADVIGHLAVAHAQRDVPLVAVDIPSGLSSDSGQVAWNVASATLTVTFGAPKWGHVLSPACNLVGELVIADIGIPRRAILETGAQLFLLEAGDALRSFPPRPPGTHKGTYGHVLLVAGSLGKAGAAVLAATAALRAGAGLLTVATPASVLASVAAGRAEAMTEPLPTDAEGALAGGALARVLALAERRDAVVLGPGLGQAGAAAELARGVVSGCTKPLVVDADGLNALAAGRGAKGALPGLPRRSATVLTPHPGELARLLGSSTPDVQRRRVECARALADLTGAVVLLKGQRSVVAAPGGQAAVNPTGNPGLATGGTGDVLAGVVGALLARGVDAFSAATTGAYLHGLAGDLAARRRGFEALIAGDVAESLPEAFLALRRGEGSGAHS